MGFFARPELTNTQFKQLKGGEPLTLSGQTRIATISGFTLATGDTGISGVIITASGASSTTNNYVLTYDDGDKIIKLKESTVSGGTIPYTCRTPTTCTVGGLSANTDIYNCNLSYILECALSPIKNPELTNPSISTFSISCNDTILEVGSSLSVVGCVVPYYGRIDSYCGSNYRTYGVSGYTFDCFGSPGSFDCCLQTTEGEFANYSSSGIINEGDNIPVGVTVHFYNGDQPFNSTGGTYSTAFIASGYSENKSITGIYPWYWGTESGGIVPAGENRPTSACIKDVIANGSCSGGTICKVVGLSESTLNINFNSNYDDYIWFAVPNEITKTNWGSLSNNGVIGGVTNVGGNLFPNSELVTNVSSACWNGQTYQIYISNYQSTVSTLMEIK